MITSLFKIIGITLLSIFPSTKLADSSVNNYDLTANEVEISKFENTKNSIVFNPDVEGQSDSYVVMNQFYRLYNSYESICNEMTSSNAANYNFVLRGRFQFYSHN